MTKVHSKTSLMEGKVVANINRDELMLFVSQMSQFFRNLMIAESDPKITFPKDMSNRR